ncbi:YfhD family protein [Gordoniibacillus kamchatkensis]|uniref:YfhD family protein n=1 Tax=Gordoniibacillus kamchatkensis TaxID=1590651 RepID=UPI0009E1B703|nr:YfhD family protein [Paenibacillus sp. VKM B-2647]
MNETNRRHQKTARQLPVAKNEDVQYDAEFADEDDKEAAERAHEADARQQQ